MAARLTALSDGSKAASRPKGNSKSRCARARQPLRDDPAAPWRAVYIISFSCCFFFLLLRGGNMAHGGRKKAPVQNTG